MSNDQHPTNERLIDYLHGELSPHEDAMVHAHLATCSQCTQSRDVEAQLTDLLRAHACTQERELPPGLVTAIYATAKDDRPTPVWWARLGSAFRPAIALPTAAAIALAAYFGISSMHGGSTRATTIEAAYYIEDHAALATTAPFAEGSVVPAMLTSDDAAADARAVDEAH